MVIFSLFWICRTYLLKEFEHQIYLAWVARLVIKVRQSLTRHKLVVTKGPLEHRMICYYLKDALEVNREGLPGLILAQLQARLDHLNDLFLQDGRALLLLGTPLGQLLWILPMENGLKYIHFHSRPSALCRQDGSDLFPPLLQGRPVTFVQRLLILGNSQFSWNGHFEAKLQIGTEIRI